MVSSICLVVPLFVCFIAMLLYSNQGSDFNVIRWFDTIQACQVEHEYGCFIFVIFLQFQFNGFNVMFPDQSRPFNNTYRCYSVSMFPGNERQDVEKGGKSECPILNYVIDLCILDQPITLSNGEIFVFAVIMPPSALDQLTRLNVEYPMLFKLTNGKKARTTHAGVLEFVADEGKIYIPYWVCPIDTTNPLHFTTLDSQSTLTFFCR